MKEQKMMKRRAQRRESIEMQSSQSWRRSRRRRTARGGQGDAPTEERGDVHAMHNASMHVHHNLTGVEDEHAHRDEEGKIGLIGFVVKMQN